MLEIIGAIFIIILGSLSHFVYDWFNHNKVVGYFVAVNESTWEHLKLVILPTYIWLVVEYHFYFDNQALYFAKFISLGIMLVIIPIIFYTYTKFSKKSILFVDISSFVAAVIVGQFVFSKLLNVTLFSNKIFVHAGLIGLIIIFFSYIMNTYVPKKNFLYKDPITNKYGIEAHIDDNQKN